MNTYILHYKPNLFSVIECYTEWLNGIVDKVKVTVTMLILDDEWMRIIRI